MTRTANRMTEAVAKLASTFATHAAETVTYTRPGAGGFTLTDLAATIGRTPYEVSDGQVMTVYESRDYLVLAASLVNGSSAVTPQAGDQITDADGRVYEVSAPKPSNVYERIGPTGAVVKIHTKGPF